MSDGNNKEHSCTEFNGVCAEHSGVQESLSGIKTSITEVKNSIKEVFDLVTKKVVDLAERPTWFTCTLISVQSTTIGVLLTFILYKHFS
jgi:hypothetical protein